MSFLFSAGTLDLSEGEKHATALLMKLVDICEESTF